ncbi:MAG TPA: MCP four helix bundle domain-containing protein [Polyangiaceae bacterium]
MRSKPSNESLPWLIAGLVFMALLLVVGWLFHGGMGSPAQALAFKASRADLVGRMQLELASASEAEKSAVLAITDQDSQTYAEQARTASSQVAQEQHDLRALLANGGSPRERDLLSQFSKVFDDLQRVDNQVLALAVKNTNLKAYSLLFGPAADAQAQMDAALARVVTKYADSAEAKQVLPLAYGARLGVLRIQALLAPHIAEESDAKMDQMEASMTHEEQQVGEDLSGLAKLSKLASDPDLGAATASFARYAELKARILPLSRENTNVRSLALSLNQKRTAMTVCLDALDALKQEILSEPIAGVTTYGRLPKPR